MNQQISIFSSLIRFSLSLALLMPMSNLHAQGYVMTMEDEANAMAGTPRVMHRVGRLGMIEVDGEMIPHFALETVYIMPPLKFKSVREQKKYFKIAGNIKKVYPIACRIQRTIEQCIAHADSLPTKEERDKYMKFLEKDLQRQYKPEMKKLTLQQGKLLIKLIDRQCNETSYELIRQYIGKHRAWWWNVFASLSGASLKKQYDPEVDDRLVERCILLIESGQI